MKPNKRNTISIKASKKHKEKQRMKSKEVLYRGRFRPLKYICLGKVNFESSQFTETPLLSTNAALLPNLSTVGCQTAFTQRVRGTAFVKQILLSTYSGHGVQHLASNLSQRHPSCLLSKWREQNLLKYFRGDKGTVSESQMLLVDECVGHGFLIVRSAFHLLLFRFNFNYFFFI